MLKIATFNIENLDDKSDRSNPSLDERVPVLRSALNRLDADILCLQEVHGQETAAHTKRKPDRNLAALDAVLDGTKFQQYQRVHTTTQGGVAYDKRNLVILSAFDIRSSQQYRNDHIESLQYRKVTATPPDAQADRVTWERPILHAQIDVPNVGLIHVLNLHLKSRLATNVDGQTSGHKWRTAAGWAEGYFLSSIKRVGQALETRILIDKLFDEEPNANIVVCGDFNAQPGEVPVEAICGRVENTQNAALRSRVLISCSSGIAESARFSHIHHGQGNLLDHLLFSHSMLSRFQSAAIHNENLHDESLPFMSDNKFPESDHAGFVARFDTR